MRRPNPDKFSFVRIKRSVFKIAMKLGLFESTRSKRPSDCWLQPPTRTGWPAALDMIAARKRAIRDVRVPPAADRRKGQGEDGVRVIAAAAMGAHPSPGREPTTQTGHVSFLAHVRHCSRLVVGGQGPPLTFP